MPCWFYNTSLLTSLPGRLVGGAIKSTEHTLSSLFECRRVRVALISGAVLQQAQSNRRLRNPGRCNVASAQGPRNPAQATASQPARGRAEAVGQCRPFCAPPFRSGFSPAAHRGLVAPKLPPILPSQRLETPTKTWSCRAGCYRRPCSEERNGKSALSSYIRSTSTLEYSGVPQ